MANYYALKAFGGTEYVDCGSLTLPATWTASAVVSFDEVLPQKCYFYLGGGSEYVQVGYNTTGNVLKVWSNGKTPGNGTISVPINTPTQIDLEWNGSAFKLYVNGVLDYTVTPSSSFVSSLNFLQLLRGFNASDRFKGQIREFVIPGVREYTKESFPSTGLILPDSGPLNYGGDLINFGGYTVNSWWVFYEEGGVANTSDIAFNGLQPLFAVSMDTTVPVNTADIAFNGLQPVFAVSMDTTVPVNTADIDFNGLQPVFAVSLTNGIINIRVIPETNFHIPYQSSNMKVKYNDSDFNT